MNFRIFSKKHNLYTNDPFWPSNQHSDSEFTVSTDGEVLEIVYDKSGGSCGGIYVKTHSSNDFIIEPWTGFFDSKGRRIYRGDIISMRSMFDFYSEVRWENGRFILFPLDREGIQSDMCNPDYIKLWEITGNIHENS